MLFEFLNQYKEKIIELCREKVLAAGESKPTSALLDRGLPIFFDELIEVLRRTAGPVINDANHQLKIKEKDAAAHGKESLRLGYTVSQVGHAYGAVCHTVTEFAKTKCFPITSPEFHDLNLALDNAIAEAVTEFQKAQIKNISTADVERLGFLIHELGNSLAAASIAHNMIQKGQVGTAGSTARVLGGALERMRQVIEGSLAEVRLRSPAVVDQTQIRLIDIISEVEATAVIMEKSKEIHLEIDVDPAIQLTVDHHLLFSALSNLVNNAVKFTRRGRVSVRGKESGERILIEVEDECGGLPKGKTEELFKSFIQSSTDKTGMGLGLSLSRRAIELNQGKLTVRNIPNKGCVFTIDLPKGEKLSEDHIQHLDAARGR